MKAVSAHAPVRIDLAGGTLDIWPLHLLLAEPAVTVNVALDLPATARVEPAAPGADAGTILLVSRDQDVSVGHADLEALETALDGGDCPLPLLAEAVRAVRPQGGFSLTTRAASPAGAGLGGSSALLCVVLGALLEAEGEHADARTLQSLAQDVETRVLGKPTGYQDYFPALLGGCLALEGAVGGIRIERLPVDLEALARRLRLVYTGLPHASGLTNWGVVRAFLDGECATVDALEELGTIARQVRQHLRAGQQDAALRLVIEDGVVRRRMAPGVGTPALEALDADVRRAGARGTKVLGAGGGGCVLVVLEDEGAAASVDACILAGPWQSLPLSLAAPGLRVDVS